MKPRHPRLRKLARVAFVAFLLVVAWLLVRAARAIDWTAVKATIAAYDAQTLVIAATLTLTSYLVYSGYDIAARRYAHHTLPTGRTMLVAAISYAFALNIGAVVGGTGIRFRLYSHAGLGVAAISRVVAFSISTNWLGYLVLAGGLFASRSLAPPPGWEVGADGLQVAGFLMLLAALLYVIACHRMHGRIFHVRGHHLRLPSVPLALTQFALAAVNWSLMAGIVHLLLPAGPGYATVLSVFLLAAVASALVHVPAGIGVIEAVFVALIGHVAPPPQIVAALLAYRAFYYLAPMLAAVVLYLLLEARGKAPAG